MRNNIEVKINNVGAFVLVNGESVGKVIDINGKNVFTTSEGTDEKYLKTNYNVTGDEIKKTLEKYLNCKIYMHYGLLMSDC